MAVKRSLTPLRLPRSFYPTKLPYKQQNVPTRRFRLFCVGTFFWFAGTITTGTPATTTFLPQTGNLICKKNEKNEIRQQQPRRTSRRENIALSCEKCLFSRLFQLQDTEKQQLEDFSSCCRNGRGDRIWTCDLLVPKPSGSIAFYTLFTVYHAYHLPSTYIIKWLTNKE